ncbi:condensation domain-containing protein, partial [Rhodococcus oxybenzonivorans]
AGPRPRWIPLSPAQKRMWFLNQYDTTSPAYNIPLTLHLTGHLDTTALEHALTDLTTRHETLRTTYPLHHGQPTQHIHPPTPHHLPTTTTTESQLPQHITTDTTTGFDVTTDTPLRTHLYQLTPHHHILTLVLHHISADGHSLTPLLRDLVTAYTAHTHHHTPHLTPLTIHYADYTLWQHQLLGTTDDPHSLITTQLHYWKNTLHA